MGAFYRNEYDLYAEIRKDPPAWLSMALKALVAADRMDLENDLKDAAQEVVALESYESAGQQLRGLLGILNAAIGVQPDVQKV